jgi:hypothetical protein
MVSLLSKFCRVQLRSIPELESMPAGTSSTSSAFVLFPIAASKRPHSSATMRMQAIAVSSPSERRPVSQQPRPEESRAARPASGAAEASDSRVKVRVTTEAARSVATGAAGTKRAREAHLAASSAALLSDSQSSPGDLFVSAQESNASRSQAWSSGAEQSAPMPGTPVSPRRAALSHADVSGLHSFALPMSPVETHATPFTRAQTPRAAEPAGAGDGSAWASVQLSLTESRLDSFDLGVPRLDARHLLAPLPQHSLRPYSSEGLPSRHTQVSPQRHESGRAHRSEGLPLAAATSYGHILYSPWSSPARSPLQYSRYNARAAHGRERWASDSQLRLPPLSEGAALNASESALAWARSICSGSSGLGGRRIQITASGRSSQRAEDCGPLSDSSDTGGASTSNAMLSPARSGSAPCFHPVSAALAEAQAAVAAAAARQAAVLGAMQPAAERDVPHLHQGYGKRTHASHSGLHAGVHGGVASAAAEDTTSLYAPGRASCPASTLKHVEQHTSEIDPALSAQQDGSSFFLPLPPAGHTASV